MNILILEDDHKQHKWLKDELEQHFPEASFQIVTSELSFRQQLDALAAAPPDVALFDMMVRWTKPAPDMELPPNYILEAGFHEAGQRCQSLLHTQEETRHVPVIFYTILSSEALSPGSQQALDDSKVLFLQKGSEVRSLVEHIKAVLVPKDVQELP